MHGQKFGKLQVIDRMNTIGKNSKWKCRCDCGNEIITTRCNLIQGHTQSCGCLNSPDECEYEKQQKVRFFNFVEKSPTCWIWKGALDKGGYGCFNHRKQMVKAHRYSYILFKGTLKSGNFICHTCDNRKCVNPDHLYLGTRTSNAQDLKDRNRWGKIRKPLSEKQKQACKILNQNGFSKYEIAEVLNISYGAVTTNVK